MSTLPPTREEIARTIFVGNIPDGVGGDDGMERILETAGKLVRWTCDPGRSYSTICAGVRITDA